MNTLKQEKDITDEDQEVYEWIEVTTFEEAARGESWFIRGRCKGGFEIIIPAEEKGQI